MPRHSYQFSDGTLTPTNDHDELRLFAAAMEAPEIHETMASLRITVPRNFSFVHCDRGDDPPDIEAFGLGWECTDFPPNQKPLQHIHKNWKGGIMNVPPLSETGRSIGQMWEMANPHRYDRFVSVADQVAALKDDFLQNVLFGTKPKDNAANQILLVNHLASLQHDLAADAICAALEEQKPRYIRAIVIVYQTLANGPEYRWERHVKSFIP
jgi:hypothetical protein